jgi:hypothetical protein
MLRDALRNAWCQLKNAMTVAIRLRLAAGSLRPGS